MVLDSAQGSLDVKRELANDLLAITTVFVAKHHGMRASANRKRRREEGEKTAEEEEEGDDSKGEEATSREVPQNTPVSQSRATRNAQTMVWNGKVDVQLVSRGHPKGQSSSRV